MVVRDEVNNGPIHIRSRVTSKAAAPESRRASKLPQSAKPRAHACTNPRARPQTNFCLSNFSLKGSQSKLTHRKPLCFRTSCRTHTYSFGRKSPDSYRNGRMRKRAAIEAACLRLTRSFTSIPPDAPSGRLHSSFLGLGVYARCPCADEDMSLRLRGVGPSHA